MKCALILGHRKRRLEIYCNHYIVILYSSCLIINHTLFIDNSYLVLFHLNSVRNKIIVRKLRLVIIEYDDTLITASLCVILNH